MANELVRLDGCKKPFQQRKTISLQTPLDGVQPIGLASMGCTPVVTTLAAANHAIASRVKEKNGLYDRLLLTSANSADLTAANPGYSAYVAAFRGDNPVVGTTTSPYPVGDITWNFTFSRLGVPIAVNEKSGFFPFNGGIYGNAPFGFGSGVAGDSVIILGGGEEFAYGGLYAAYKNFHQSFQVGYVPSGYSLTAHLVSGILQSATTTLPAATADFTTSGSPSTATAFCPMWECNPVLTTQQGQSIPVTGNPPGWVRDYQLVPCGDITIGAFGSDTTGAYSFSPWRPWLVVYASSTVTNLTLNGIPADAFGGTLMGIKLPYISSVLTFDHPVGYSFEFDPVNTTSFAFEWDAGTDHFAPTPQMVGTLGSARFYEMLITLP